MPTRNHLRSLTVLTAAWAIALTLSAVTASTGYARTFYVGPGGSDSRNQGQAQNRGTPWRSISRGVREARGGDEIVVLDGEYFENVYINRSGYAGGDLVLRTENRNGAKINGWIFSNDQRFITISGFEVINYTDVAPTKGISFVRCDHITVRDCRVHNCYGGGIGFDQSDWILCEWNIVYANAWYEPGQHSGISVFQPQYRNSSNRKYGIVIRNNTAFDNWNYVANAAIGRPTDGSGIVLDDFKGTQGGLTPYDRMTLVENNLVFNNGGSGVHIFSSQNIQVRNNSIIQNSGNVTLTGEVTLSNSNRVYVYNNILYPTRGKYSAFNLSSSGFAVFNNMVAGPNYAVPYDPTQIEANPAFIPGTFIPTHPLTFGTGIDAGDHFQYDVYGSPRFKNRIDIGAVEQ